MKYIYLYSVYSLFKNFGIELEMKPIYKLLVPAAFCEHVFEDSKDNVQPGERVLVCWLCFMELQTLQFFDCS